MTDSEATPATPSPQPPAAPRRRRLSARRKLMMALVAFGLFGFVAAVIIELVFAFLVPVTDVAFVFWDPSTGLRRVPDQAGRRISGGHIDIRYNINAQGWNHPEDYVTTKPPGTRRVCLVGDSQVEAMQVNVDEAMHLVAAEKMSRPDRPVQWYAFGSSGLGTTQEYEIIRHYALDYQPDVVILLFLQNDPFDSSPYIVNPSPNEPRYYLDEQDRLTLLPAQKWEPVTWRRMASKLATARYLLIQKRLMQRLKSGNRPKRAYVGGQPLREDSGAPPPKEIKGLAEMTMEQRERRTWELIEKLLAATRDACANRGAKFAIAFRGWTPEIEEPITERTDTVASKQDDPFCLGQRVSLMGPEVVAPMAKRLGIPYLDLTDALRAEVNRTGKSHRFPDDNHFSTLGHQAAGAAMAEWVEQMLAD